MRIVCNGLIAALLLGGTASTGQAWWFGNWGSTGCSEQCCEDQGPDACEKCIAGYHQNSQWPSPYVCPDRVYAHAPFDAMIRNGWRRQNLLGSHHFNENSTELTQAGQLKVRWIMTQAPPQYRRVFVERSFADGQTDARIAAATQFANKAAGEGAPPQVLATHIFSEGRPAGTVDYVNGQFRENMRIPVLPASTTATSGQ